MNLQGLRYSDFSSMIFIVRVFVIVRLFKGVAYLEQACILYSVSEIYIVSTSMLFYVC